jgi:hypothetical protein
VSGDGQKQELKKKIRLGTGALWSWGSSASVVSDYILDAIDVQSLSMARDCSSNLCVQTGSGAHPASYTMGNGGPFPRDKVRPGSDADHSPHLVLRS